MVGGLEEAEYYVFDVVSDVLVTIELKGVAFWFSVVFLVLPVFVLSGAMWKVWGLLGNHLDGWLKEILSKLTWRTLGFCRMV